MHRAGRLLVVLALALAVAVSPAGAQQSFSINEAIYADFALDGRIDQPWSTEQLKGALEAARGQGDSFVRFQRAVGAAYEESLLGLEEGVPSVPTPDDGSSGLLPEPTAAGDRERPPWPFIGLSLLGGALLLGGAGSSIYRRLAR